MPELSAQDALALLTGAAKPKPPEPAKPKNPPRRHPFEPGAGGTCRRCRKTLGDGWHYNGNTVDTRKYGVNAPF